MDDKDSINSQYMYTLGASAWLRRNAGKSDAFSFTSLMRVKNAVNQHVGEDELIRGLQNCLELSREDTGRGEVSFYLESIRMATGQSCSRGLVTRPCHASTGTIPFGQRSIIHGSGNLGAKSEELNA